VLSCELVKSSSDITKESPQLAANAHGGAAGGGSYVITIGLSSKLKNMLFNASGAGMPRKEL
jgi:hypothetical protein